MKIYKGYVLIDPNTNIPRYVGITKRSLRKRFAGHLNDVYTRPDLNKHKTAWFKILLKQGKLPKIKLVASFDTLEEVKQFEINYIKKYKEKYKLINQTAGGDYIAENAHSRESILKKKTTRKVVQYNCLGEKIAEYEIMEDIGRTLNLKPKACSHITQCCKKLRICAYGYIWRYKGDPLGDISDIDPESIFFNKIVQYDLEGNRIGEFSSYAQAAKSIGDMSGGSNIQLIIKGRQKTCKGFTFQLEPIYVYFDQSKFDNRKLQYKKIKDAPTSKMVLQYDLSGNFINSYESISKAALFVCNSYHSRQYIQKCCENKINSYHNYIWKFK